MNKLLLSIFILISSLIFSSTYNVNDDANMTRYKDYKDTIYVCHWRKIEKSKCIKGDFLDWFSGIKAKTETKRSIAPRLYCEEGTYYRMLKDGPYADTILTGGAITNRIYCVYNGKPWLEVVQRK